jgi:hypothetical protein
VLMYHVGRVGLQVPGSSGNVARGKSRTTGTWKQW